MTPAEQLLSQKRSADDSYKAVGVLGDPEECNRKLCVFDKTVNSIKFI